VAVAPILNKALFDIVPTKKIFENVTAEDANSCILKFVKEVLLLNVRNTATLKLFCKKYLNEFFVDVALPNHKDLMMLIHNKLSTKFNLYIGFCEGSHRSVAIHFAFSRYFEGGIPFVPTNNSRLVLGPSVRLDLLSPSTEYVSAKISLSEEFINIRQNSVRHYLWDDYCSLITRAVQEDIQKKSVFLPCSTIQYLDNTVAQVTAMVTTALIQSKLNQGHEHFANTMLHQVQEEVRSFKTVYATRTTSKRNQYTILQKVANTDKELMAQLKERKSTNQVRSMYFFMLMELTAKRFHEKALFLSDFFLMSSKDETTAMIPMWLGLFEATLITTVDDFRVFTRQDHKVQPRSAAKKINFLLIMQCFFQFWDVWYRYKDTISSFTTRFVNYNTSSQSCEGDHDIAAEGDCISFFLLLVKDFYNPIKNRFSFPTVRKIGVLPTIQVYNNVYEILAMAMMDYNEDQQGLLTLLINLTDTSQASSLLSSLDDTHDPSIVVQKLPFSHTQRRQCQGIVLEY